MQKQGVNLNVGLDIESVIREDCSNEDSLSQSHKYKQRNLHMIYDQQLIPHMPVNAMLCRTC